MERVDGRGCRDSCRRRLKGDAPTSIHRTSTHTTPFHGRISLLNRPRSHCQSSPGPAHGKLEYLKVWKPLDIASVGAAGPLLGVLGAEHGFNCVIPASPTAGCACPHRRSGASPASRRAHRTELAFGSILRPLPWHHWRSRRHHGLCRHVRPVHPVAASGRRPVLLCGQHRLLMRTPRGAQRPTNASRQNPANVQQRDRPTTRAITSSGARRHLAVESLHHAHPCHRQIRRSDWCR